MLFKDLQTERLMLKNISEEDTDFILRVFSNNNVNRYLYDAEPLTNIEEATEIVDFYLQPEPRGHHRWIVIDKESGSKMGTCGVHCWDKKEGKVDIGYDLIPDFWGKGFMQEAIKEIIQFAKDEMNIKEVNANIYIDNASSTKLVEKMGFTIAGTYNEIFRGEKYLHNRYSLILS